MSLLIKGIEAVEVGRIQALKRKVSWACAPHNVFWCLVHKKDSSMLLRDELGIPLLFEKRDQARMRLARLKGEQKSLSLSPREVFYAQRAKDFTTGICSISANRYHTPGVYPLSRGIEVYNKAVSKVIKAHPWSKVIKAYP